MNTLKSTIAKRIENLKTVLYDINQEKMLEDFNSLSFDLNSINFLSSVANRCHPKVWGDIYIQNHYDFLDELSGIFGVGFWPRFLEKVKS